MRLEIPIIARLSRCGFMFSSRQMLGLGLAGALLASGAVGCKARKDDIGIDMQPVELHPLSMGGPRPDALTNVSGQRMGQEAPAPLKQPEVGVVPGSAPGIRMSSGEIGLPRVGGGFRGADADYIDKADVYWKLNWIRKQLLAGLLPSNLTEAVQKTRRQLLTTKQDKNYLIAEEAIRHLEQGLEHLKAHRLLQSSHAPIAMVPWSAGRDSVQRFIDSGRLGFGGKESALDASRPDEENGRDDSPLRRYWRGQRGSGGTALSSSQQEVLDTVLKYAEKYHAAPQEMMQREWRKAIEKTNDLRDELGLMNRAENKDGDSTYIPASVDQTTTREPMDLLKNTVPIPDIHGAGHRNIPKEATIEPKDPFASDP